MIQTPESISAKVQEIYEEVRNSETPISLLGYHGALLRARSDWTSVEVERVSSQVLTLLIRHGWKKPNA